MQYEELENQMNFLLSAALQKCGNSYDAEDLTQETLVSALSYLAKGKTIEDMRAWLLTVLNRKWNDALRRKYRQPIICIGEDLELAEPKDPFCSSEEQEQAERLRSSIAFLAKNYREVIVRHYLNGESIAKLAAELQVPEGTIKSRLYNGREQLRKGIDNMETVRNQSYQPITLCIQNSGMWGRNGEPGSLVNRDLLAQNILWAAYERPLPADEIAKAIGTPAAYVEPVIQKLVDGELMKQVGNKYYTDFIIFTVEDEERYLPEQKNFVKEQFYQIWNAIDHALQQLRRQDFYQRYPIDEQNSIELYVAFHCLDYGIYGTLSTIVNQTQQFPDRPDGGNWIAFGHVHFKPFRPKEHLDLMAHAYSGERWVRLENDMNSKLLELHVYGADGFPDFPYDRSPDYTFLRESDNIDEILTRLLYLIHTQTDPESVGFNIEYLKAIPWLTRCKILREESGKPQVNIPILTQEEFRKLCQILTEVKQTMWHNENLTALLKQLIVGKRKKIPAHLNSVPLQMQYRYAANALLFATIREAMLCGKLYDGKYDNDSESVRQHPCPMFLVIQP